MVENNPLGRGRPLKGLRPVVCSPVISGNSLSQRYLYIFIDENQALYLSARQIAIFLLVLVQLLLRLVRRLPGAFCCILIGCD